MVGGQLKGSSEHSTTSICRCVKVSLLLSERAIGRPYLDCGHMEVAGIDVASQPEHYLKPDQVPRH